MGRSAKRRATRRRVAARKARRAKKAKNTPVVGSKRQVWNGTRARTVGGLTKRDLCISKTGCIVSKKRAARGRSLMKETGLGRSIAAVRQVCKEMGLVGFVAIKKGIPYYD